MKPVLDVTAVSMNFGGLRALNEVQLEVNSGEIVALIGPNGARQDHLLQLYHKHL